MSQQRTVYIIDPDLGSRRTLAAQLARVGAEAWPFADGAEFLAIFEHLTPAVVLLDIDIESPRGIEILGEITRRRPGWPVLAMSAKADVKAAVAAMKLGALDVLIKPIETPGLAEALAPAFARLDSALETSEGTRRAADRLVKLSPRERDIALALFAGQSNKAVAHLLGISVRTVEMHRAHIMTKLEVKTIAEAAVLATQAGLTSATPRLHPRPVAEVATLLPRRAMGRR